MVNKLTLPSKENDVQLKVNEIIDEYVDKASAQDITGVKTFIGEKKITFKQQANTNKLGFTLYDNSNNEVGAFEYRPNTIAGKAFLQLNASYAGSTYVGFRYWGNVNIVAPKPSAGIYYIPLRITDGNAYSTADNTGVLNISSLLPTVNNPTITITQGDVTKGSFTLNQATGATIVLDSGGSVINTDGVTINTNADDELQAIGVIEKNAGNVKYDWVGTSAEYTAQNVATLHPDWVCYITDDETPSNFANVDASNFTSTGKSSLAEYAMPSDIYVDLSVPSDGTLYTAPANGWLVLKGTINAQVGLVGFDYLPNGIATYNWASLSGNDVASYIPVSKGQTVALRRVNIGSLSTARFYYAKGEI